MDFTMNNINNINIGNRNQSNSVNHIQSMELNPNVKMPGLSIPEQILG
jgi:hypothetical protein